MHELRVSTQHARALRARGAVESGRGHYPLLVVLHTAFPIALAAEVIEGGARPPRLWPLALAALAIAAALRAWSMAALGELWTARVLVPPGAARVHRGPYRWLAHPSYLAAAIELAAAPLMFGAWRTALALSLLNVPLLAARVRCERRALGEGKRLSAP
ncbi:MAG: isoprenylcysteine carboxylmethyltransferase family protein [Candidatus Eiseniibacteriota bacterium]